MWRVCRGEEVGILKASESRLNNLVKADSGFVRGVYIMMLRSRAKDAVIVITEASSTGRARFRIT